MELESHYLLQNYARYPLVLHRGEGPYVWDTDGNRYLDFIAGIGVNALGHAHPVPEVPQMFATGAIQAMITSSATGTSTKAWEFVKNYYNTSAFHPKNAVVVNTRALQRLPKEEQNALRKSAATAEKRGWDMSKERERDGYRGAG